MKPTCTTLTYFTLARGQTGENPLQTCHHGVRRSWHHWPGVSWSCPCARRVWEMQASPPAVTGMALVTAVIWTWAGDKVSPRPFGRRRNGSVDDWVVQTARFQGGTDVGGRRPEAGRSYLKNRKHFAADSQGPLVTWGLTYADFQWDEARSGVQICEHLGRPAPGSSDGTLITMTQVESSCFFSACCWSAFKPGRAAWQTRLFVLYPHGFRLMGAPACLGSSTLSRWWSEMEFAGSVSIGGRNLWPLRTSLSNGELMVLHWHQH